MFRRKLCDNLNENCAERGQSGAQRRCEMSTLVRPYRRVNRTDAICDDDERQKGALASAPFSGSRAGLD
jgi:hypothetical protein